MITEKHSGEIVLKRIVDERGGSLCILNSLKEIPFDIKRVYYTNNLNGYSGTRGKHAHRQLRQVIFCANGSFTLSLDDGVNKRDIIMSQNNVGIVLEPMVWHTMHDFSEECVILVVASDYYDESDYIRSYYEFMRLVKMGK